MKKMIRLTIAALLLVSIILSACQAEDDEGSPLPDGSPLAPVESPLVKPSPTDVPSKGDQENIKVVDRLFEMAREDLANELGVDADEIELVEVQSVDWANSSLGCPQEGMMYLQVITPGYKLTLEVDGQQHVYHTDNREHMVRCEAKNK